MSGMSSANDRRKIRLATYMVPGLPLGLYQVFQRYLEQVLDCDSTLLVESRWSGPPPGHRDLFTSNDVDIGFLCSSSYLQHMELKNPYMELLPAIPVHRHPKTELNPIYYAEVLVRKGQSDFYKEFEDLHGCKWGVNDELSLSGNLTVLLHLKKMGLNANFFGNLMHTGSHHQSIEMLLDGRIDGASIDSNVLQNYLMQHPEYKDRFHVVRSLGPLPTQPVVVNSRMSADLKERVCRAFLDMNKSEQWSAELDKYNVWGFKQASDELYAREKEIRDLVKGLSIKPIYY